MSTYITTQFKKATETLDYLGIDNPFKLEDIKVSPQLQSRLKSRKAVMVITPKIDSSFTFRDLVAKHDAALGKDAYISDYFGSDSYDGTQEPRVSFIYMDGDGSHDKEEGLYGCNKTVDEQLAQLKKLPGDVKAVNPVEYVILFAMFRDKPLDRYAWTQFIGNPIQGSHLVRCGGTWNDWTNDGVFKLRLRGGDPFADSYYGFRVSQGLSLTPSNLAPCDTSSSDADAPERASEVDRKDDELSAIARGLQEIVDRKKEAEYHRGFEAGRASVKEELKGMLES